MSRATRRARPAESLRPTTSQPRLRTSARLPAPKPDRQNDREKTDGRCDQTMGVFEKYSADPLRDREKKHVVAESRRPIGHSETDSFARHHSAAANEEERRSGREAGEAVEPRSPICGTAAHVRIDRRQSERDRLVYPPDGFLERVRRTRPLGLAVLGAPGGGDVPRSRTDWRFARRTGRGRRCALRAGKFRRSFNHA